MGYAEEFTNEPVVVRKYGNRRLYRTDESRYVTLDELAQLVRDDVDFVVRDARTNDDLTGVVLAQIILETEKAEPGGRFPQRLLRELIRSHDHDLGDFVTHHLPRLAELYVASREAVAESLDAAVTSHMDVDEVAIIAQLASVQAQLKQILDALEVEEI